MTAGPTALRGSGSPTSPPCLLARGGIIGNGSGGYDDNDGDDDGDDDDEGERHRGDCSDEYGIVATFSDNTVTSWLHAGGADRRWSERMLVGLVDLASLSRYLSPLRAAARDRSSSSSSRRNE